MKLVLVDCDDWVGLYVDGELVDEGHSIPLRNFAIYCGVDFTTNYDVDRDWLDEVGNLPDKLSDVKFVR